MTKAERWKAVDDLFHRALDVPEGERSSFLQALQARIERRSDAVEAPKPRFRLTATVTESPSQ